MSDHQRLIQYLDKTCLPHLERIVCPKSFDQVREYMEQVWAYRHTDMDPGHIIIFGYVFSEGEEEWFRYNVYELYREIDRENQIRLANDFNVHHSLLEKYGCYFYYYYDPEKTYTLHCYVNASCYEISEKNPVITCLKSQ